MSHHLQPAVGRRSVALADSRSAARSLKWENKKIRAASKSFYTSEVALRSKGRRALSLFQ
jgi:hypothetical protein